MFVILCVSKTHGGVGGLIFFFLLKNYYLNSHPHI